MPIIFKSGGDLTLRQTLEFTDRGSRSPHPGGGNNMTTILMQLGIPTVFFWEVKAGLSGYEVTNLGDQKISFDFDKCGPWAQFDPKLWEKRLSTLPQVVIEVIKDCKTPYQAHHRIANVAFPGVVESSAAFYLRNRDVIEPALRVLAESRFAGHFSKRVTPNGKIVNATNSYKEIVMYENGSHVTNNNLASGYLTLLEVVRASELDKGVNPLHSGLEGVLPDARVMSVLDMAIFALNTRSDKVYAWSGVAMFQYILKEADSQRWRETTSFMYDLVWHEVLPDLPEELEFVLIPTQGLGQLVVTDKEKADEINQLVAILHTPPEYTAQILSEKFREKVSGMTKSQVLEYLTAQIPESSFVRLRTMIDEDNINGACGVVAHFLQEKWIKENLEERKKIKAELGQKLVDESGQFILHNQPIITPLEILQGKRLYLIEGILDIPTGKLEAQRTKYQEMAKGKAKRKKGSLGFGTGSHAGWDW
ncbi:hypothetical protein A2962_01910 [Candidatus Woesebacteria bacterium RIFCSPLOWO2_01_FULL_39_61]|uniref:Uncharacterized protein n=1 Tax=Candidatus Woesebacteria bacterium RIFCSPHIGHO2_02_FULL_39_13 TaxID=1802505 RepID=A0A1F7Z1E9_9BACT|nr:MAG: hypothetical protein A2692_02630 [Candidatus Woesebacteria bacterium RIFCSPHIGHO2_01_FULL_39_95]OGM33264.1 MAG: hypothetical protein A3D01_00550 [Candidatus Woesebacteria bacterium RIFCSPHIGHO2_02_FULL_39_13]OGM38436.1 MAG: hypothetical protein A3E13_00430 [Candidatus Woesebacteria bacterium RIFCSPHIGHO2_12_FULL_40_20]OGM66874.1 MAG: hypothetical protein A2962_01910 [Candidatus Woesebacteria bacterium RIFCSPLOWO2_01_FULL_39_61]OGM75314.1 MAG: hypothetical protein A3H19_02810 [Candidatus